MSQAAGNSWKSILEWTLELWIFNPCLDVVLKSQLLHWIAKSSGKVEKTGPHTSQWQGTHLHRIGSTWVLLTYWEVKKLIHKFHNNADTHNELQCKGCENKL